VSENNIYILTVKKKKQFRACNILQKQQWLKELKNRTSWKINAVIVRTVYRILAELL